MPTTRTVASTPDTVRSGYLDPAAQPVAVTGAEPGDVIEVSVTALPHDFAEPYVHYFTFDEARTTTEFTHGIELAMAPFLGVVATEPAGDQRVSAIVSGSYGGNLVLRDLGAGSHLFLPVAKSGGRVWIGDVHALQGDGVVDQTAIETAAENIEIRYDLHKQVVLPGPLGETDDSWIVVGFAASLGNALASMAVSFRVTQYANQTGSAYTSTPPKAVHAVVPKSVFPAELRDRVARWLRP